MKKLVLILSLLAASMAFASGCDSLPFTALNSATDTPTRTPRPTFTPRAAATSKPTEIPTQAAVDTPTESSAEPSALPVTETPEVQAPDTPTPKPVVKVTRPPAAPSNTPQPAAPQFAVHPDFGQKTFCPQDGIYEIMIYAKNDGGSPRPFAGGLYYAVFSGGQLLRDGAGKGLVGTTDAIGSISYGSNCNVSYDRLHPNQNNGKLDVSDVVRRGTTQLAFRFIRSPTDLTPLSADVPIDFSQAGRWWLAFGYAGG